VFWNSAGVLRLLREFRHLHHEVRAGSFHPLLDFRVLFLLRVDLFFAARRTPA